MVDKENTEGRFSRWSKRKLDAKAAEEIEHEAVAVEEVELEDEATVEREKMLLANKEAAEAIDIEAIDKESDISAFFKEGVPEFLKKKAMQTMWRSSPIFANVDGLCDYDEDFGSPDLNMKVFKSAYQAGKGYAQLFLDDEDKDTEILDEQLDAAPETKELDDQEEIETVSGEEDAQPNKELSSEDEIEVSELENASADNEMLEEVEVAYETELPRRVSLRHRLALER